MGLRLHNTLTRTKEDFVPIDPKSVRMYVCGPTVYDFAHIGNARPLIVFDVLFRLLRHLYGAEHVTYVRNITDVEDKINARAAEEYPDLPLNEAIGKVTGKTEKQFHEDAAALGCLEPTLEPRATEYIDRPDAPEDMIRLIARLIEKGNAYVAEGHVLFDVSTMPDYGKLSNRSLDDMIAGARVEVAPYKKNPMDFVLWKPSNQEARSGATGKAKGGEPAWLSPWGSGRPGWHIECSAMAGALLGPVFDIHGGGIDLIFPHHENEIAQSRCAHGTETMARYWMHNGFLQVEGEKMSKSVGNFVTVRDVLSEWPGQVARLNMLKTHYRLPIDWMTVGLQESRKLYVEWVSALASAAPAFRRESDADAIPAELLEALFDDLNTHRALQIVHELSDLVTRGASIAVAEALAASLDLLGLLPDDPSAVREQLLRPRDRSTDGLDRLIAARAVARKAKNFAEADRIRDELDAMGIALKDAKDPKTGELVTTWEVKR